MIDNHIKLKLNWARAPILTVRLFPPPTKPNRPKIRSLKVVLETAFISPYTHFCSSEKRLIGNFMASSTKTYSQRGHSYLTLWPFHQLTLLEGGLQTSEFEGRFLGSLFLMKTSLGTKLYIFILFIILSLVTPFGFGFWHIIGKGQRYGRGK